MDGLHPPGSGEVPICPMSLLVYGGVHCLRGFHYCRGGGRKGMLLCVHVVVRTEDAVGVLYCDILSVCPYQFVVVYRLVYKVHQEYVNGFQ
jgi:hypothetical protein